MAADIYTFKDSENKLVHPETRKKIFRTVLIVHIVLITLLLTWGFFVELFRPARPKVITVSLYSPPENPGPQVAVPQVKTVKPQPKPEVKTAAQPVKKSKPRKKWKPATKIKVSREVVYVKPQKTVRQPEVISKQKLVKSLQSRVNIRSSNHSGVAQSYENSVGAYLYQQWQTPDKSVLGGKRPEVEISLSIAANGQVLNARILRASGISAMDSSVKQLLASLKYLPAPPDGNRNITLILEVIE